MPSLHTHLPKYILLLIGTIISGCAQQPIQLIQQQEPIKNYESSTIKVTAHFVEIENYAQETPIIALNLTNKTNTPYYIEPYSLKPFLYTPEEFIALNPPDDFDLKPTLYVIGGYCAAIGISPILMLASMVTSKPGCSSGLFLIIAPIFTAIYLAPFALIGIAGTIIHAFISSQRAALKAQDIAAQFFDNRQRHHLVSHSTHTIIIAINRHDLFSNPIEFDVVNTEKNTIEHCVLR